MATFIEPKKLYHTLSQKQFAELQAQVCAPGQKETGNFSLMQRPNYVLFTSLKEKTALRIDSDNSTIHFVIGMPVQAIAVDKNGNGIRDPGDEGDFNKLQSILATAQRFSENPKEIVRRCVGKTPDVSELDVKGLFAKLNDPQLARFKVTTETLACPGGQDHTSGFGFYTSFSFGSPGVTFYNYNLQASARISFDIGTITFVKATCGRFDMDEGGGDMNADGKLEMGNQQRYDNFLAAMREFIKDPSKAEAISPCAPCK